MTIAAAFPCKDGLVLCADTQETISGYAKTDTEKIRIYSTPTYNAVFTGAGDADLLEMTMDEISRRLSKTGASTVFDVEDVFKESLRDIFNNSIVPYNSYVYEERPTIPQMLIGLQYESAVLLYKASGTKLRRLREPETVGMGLALAKSLTGQLFHDGLQLPQAGLVALYVLQQAKRWVDGCGGNSDILLLSDQGKKITRMPTADVTGMEAHFDMFNSAMRNVLIKVADASVPYSMISQVVKQFQLDMLALRGKFMKTKEFYLRLYELTGMPVPDELKNLEDD